LPVPFQGGIADLGNRRARGSERLTWCGNPLNLEVQKVEVLVKVVENIDLVAEGTELPYRLEPKERKHSILCLFVAETDGESEFRKCGHGFLKNIRCQISESDVIYRCRLLIFDCR